MGWLKKAFKEVARPFKQVGHAIEDSKDYVVPVVAGAALGMATGGIGSLVGGASLAAAASSTGAVTGAVLGGATGLQTAYGNVQAKKAAAADAANAEKIAQAMSTQPTVVSNAPAAEASSYDTATSDMNADTARKRRYSMSSTAGAGSALRRYASMATGTRTTLA